MLKFKIFAVWSQQVTNLHLTYTYQREVHFEKCKKVTLYFLINSTQNQNELAYLYIYFSLKAKNITTRWTGVWRGLPRFSSPTAPRGRSAPASSPGRSQRTAREFRGCSIGAGIVIWSSVAIRGGRRSAQGHRRSWHRARRRGPEGAWRSAGTEAATLDEERRGRRVVNFWRRRSRERAAGRARNLGARFPRWVCALISDSDRYQ